MKPLGYGSAMLNFTFEAAHRQPEVGGKCFNLHGHSFKVTVTLYNNSLPGGISTKSALSIEFSHVKGIIRGWIDHMFDHATLLGVQDEPLLSELEKLGSKVYTFGDGGDYEALPWPSVEAIAHCLGEKLTEVVRDAVGPYATVESVMVSETDVNTYIWHSPDLRDPGEVEHLQVVDKGLGMDFR